MKYQIVVDSSADILAAEYASSNIPVKVAPLTIKIGEVEYVDDELLNPSELLEKMASSSDKQTTSCPTPSAFESLFREADYTFCITISAKLSGTYNSAVLAKDIVEKAGHKVAIFDSKAVAGVERLIVQDILKYLAEGKEFDEVVSLINDTKYNLLFVLASLDNLVKNGRMGKFTGMVASFLKISPLFCAHEGEIKLVKKIRTLRKALDGLVDEMPNLAPKFSEVVITYCDNLETAEGLKKDILVKYPDVLVSLYPTRGLTTFYANKNGIIVSYK